MGILQQYEDIHRPKQPIDLTNLFEPREKADQIIEPKRLLVLGRAGIGKTTLCRRLAYQWATGELWRDRYDEASPLLLYRGHEKLIIDNVLCWPVDEFLKLIPNE